MPESRICVFCGASPGARPIFVEVAAELGTALAEAGLAVVFGAGGAGMMGAVSDAAIKAGGDVVGVIPKSLMDREYGRSDLTDLRIVATMHDRKALMHQLSQAFVTLPGGLGTFEEFFEILTWAQLGLHDKPVILLNVDGYYDPLVSLLDHSVEQGFMSAADRRLVTVVQTVPEVLKELRQLGEIPGLT
jgi:uncharacterized protein (TIGR00730 family)